MWKVGYFTDYDRVIRVLPYEYMDRKEVNSVCAFLNEHTRFRHIVLDVENYYIKPTD